MNKKTQYILWAASCYMRYTKRCNLVALEASARLQDRGHRGDRADLLAVTNDKMLVECEIKVSISDLKADIKKEIHSDLKKDSNWKYPVHIFYFCIPYELWKEALEIINKDYPSAGLLCVCAQSGRRKRNKLPKIVVRKTARIFYNKPKLTDNQIITFQRNMSNTICRQLKK